MQPSFIQPSALNLIAPSQDPDPPKPSPSPTTVYIHDLQIQDTLTCPMVGQRKVKRDWLANVPSQQYLQNIFICTKLAAVRTIQQKNLVDKSNLFKLVHLRAESTNILQNKAKEDFQQHFKTKNTRSWNLVAQKQGTNFFKTIYERKCNFNFEHINIISETKKKENITLNPYECKYKIEEVGDAGGEKVFPWLEKATCRIILTDGKDRKFAIYVPKKSDAEYIVHEIELKKVCQNIGKFEGAIRKGAQLFKKKVVVASAEKLNQNGRYSEFKKEEKEKQTLKKEIMQQNAGNVNVGSPESKAVKSPKIGMLSSRRSGYQGRLEVSTKPVQPMNRSSSPQGSLELESPARKNRANKNISPVLKIKPSNIQHPTEQIPEMEDLSLSKMMMIKIRSTIDASFVPYEEILQQSRVDLDRQRQLNMIEEKLQQEKHQSRKNSSQIDELNNTIHTPTPKSRKRKRSFYVMDDKNQMLLKQIEINEQQFESSEFMDKEEEHPSITSEDSLPRFDLDLYVTVFHLELFVKHFEEKIRMEFIQLIDPDTETSKTRAIEFRKVIIDFTRSKGNPLVFTCEHKCYTFSSASDKFRVAVQLPDRNYSLDLTLSRFDLSGSKCYGEVLYFKEAPFAGYFLFFVTKQPIPPVVQLRTVEYIKNYSDNYELRYRTLEINKKKAELKLKFNENAWQFCSKKPNEDLFQRLVYLGIPDRFKPEFYSLIPEVKLNEQNISYYQCQVLLNSFLEEMRDKIMYILNSKHDLFLQLSSLKENVMLQERVRGLMAYYQWKTGTSELFVLALIRAMVERLRGVIMGVRSKGELERMVRLYLFVEYEVDELMEETYSYMQRKS